MILDQLSSPSFVDDTLDNPARLMDHLDRLYWREQALDAVVRAAQTEIAVQQAELADLRARVADQAARLQRLQETLEAREAEVVAKDRHIRRLRSEMRVVQDYVRTTHSG